MAEYQLSRQEYEQLLDRPRAALPHAVRYLYRALLILIMLAFFALLAYLRQWLFGAFVAGFLAFVVIMARWYKPADFEGDAFKAGRVQVEVESDAIRIRAGANQVHFSYAELSNVLEYPRAFLIRHRSGMQVRIPRAPLSDTEVSILIGLQHAFPKIARKMYK